ncbi:unnamed protein product [Urochloa decumbens]|uniref:Uncharacterized protein n=1 Tax=Urochloa decumbens TaxID=240449 RepID=A0ABC9ELB8_9POAL
MEDDGLDPLGHEMNHGGSHRGQGVNHGIDLNSQASAAADGFSGFRIYQSLLQRDDLPNPTRGHPAMTRCLNFGSSSAASGAGVPTGRGRGDGGAAAQQRASTVLGLPPRRAARTAGGSQRGCHPRAARNAGRGQAPSTSDNYEEEMEEDVDVLASSGSHPKKPYLKKLLYGPPANLELLEQLWRGLTVDGSTAFVPGDDYGENEGRDVEAVDEDEFEATPRNTSNQKSKRAFASTQSTLSSPVKKSKSPMVKIVKEIAHSFKKSVKVNNMVIQKCATHNEAFSVGRCQELAFECGVERTAESVYAMSKMFETEYQREFFCGPLLTPDLRLSYFKKWCRDNNLE